MNELERHSLQNACDALLIQQQTLLLATLSALGKADISYAPYLHDNSCFYIFVSELASHTQNMLVQPQASVLFIEPESNAANPFARKRLTLDCKVREVVRLDSDYERIMQAFKYKFGEIFAVLKGLPDFHLLCLQPISGQFVAGFGKSFAVDAMGHLQSTSLVSPDSDKDRDVEI